MLKLAVRIVTTGLDGVNHSCTNMEEMSDAPRGHTVCLPYIKSRTVHFGDDSCRYIRLRLGLVYSHASLNDGDTF